MPANLSLNYTPLTDPVVWFPSVDAFNAFIGAITVTVTSAGLPAATTVAIGGVKEATMAAYNPVAIDPSYYSLPYIDEAGAAQTALVATKTRFDALEATVAALKAAMVTAGQLVET